MPISIENFLAKNHIPKEAKFLLAFSSGVDSVVLANLFISLKMNVVLAHCNFNLRGNDSFLDENFAKEFAKQNQIPIFIKSFDTKKIQETSKKGIQELARELRYNWFEEIRQKEHFDFIATAHHANDQVETILYKFIKGTGLKGLSGIKSKNGFLIRPFLFFTKENILNYAKENQLEWREDISNQSDKYARNRIRLNIIPELKKINEGLENTLQNQAQLMEWHQEFYENSFQKWFDNLEKKQENIFVPVSEIKESNKIHISTLLHRFGFFQDDIFKIINKEITETGKQIHAENYIFTLDRNVWILSKKQTEFPEIILEKNTQKFKWNNINYSITTIDKPEFFKKDILYFDLDKIQFPIKISSFEEGEKWIPLGMKTSKKISDFLIDNKVSLITKKQVGILKDAKNEIIALLDFRISENVKIDAKTQKIWVIQKEE